MLERRSNGYQNRLGNMYLSILIRTILKSTTNESSASKSRVAIGSISGKYSCAVSKYLSVTSPEGPPPMTATRIIGSGIRMDLIERWWNLNEGSFEGDSC